MKSMSGKELAKLLEANGWDLLRIHDSSHHRITYINLQ
jgi:predicted RNA binding protein YcfA (HicA-like mRNA interferase family)